MDLLELRATQPSELRSQPVWDRLARAHTAVLPLAKELLRQLFRKEVARAPPEVPSEEGWTVNALPSGAGPRCPRPFPVIRLGDRRRLDPCVRREDLLRLPGQDLDQVRWHEQREHLGVVPVVEPCTGHGGCEEGVGLDCARGA
eukprot:1020365-Lingulodinium_polyedra.AAC.1